MSESNVGSRSSVDVKELRKGVLSYLSHITASARDFYDSQRLPHSTRLGYGRLCVAAAEAVGHLLHDVEVESLEERVSALEENRIENNREENQESTTFRRKEVE